MARNREGLSSVFVIICFFALAGFSQTPPSHQLPSQAAGPHTADSATIRSTTRMVTLEVVVKDKKGNHVTGLKPEDFELFEQTPTRGKEKREQKIATFSEASVTDLPRRTSPEANHAAGVYTNRIAQQKDPVPPTILLMDGLNTDVKSQMQVHAQMVKMLAQLPSDVPVAVYMLGYKLKMLQDFTTAPKLLQIAARHAINPAGQGAAQIDPRDDPNAAGNLLIAAEAGMPGAVSSGPSGPARDMFDALDGFEAFVYDMQMDQRVHITSEALEAIAKHMSGYPGRKNLLWVSTAFPVVVDPAFDPMREHVYRRDIEKVADALSAAKIAVFPINAAGVLPPAVFNASRQGWGSRSGPGAIYAQVREMSEGLKKNDTMQLMADDTGGEACTGNNFVWDCVRRSVADSSHYYEIAYYPNSKNWNGEYRRILLEPRDKAWHLEYRQGYFATPENSKKATDVRTALKQAACGESLDETSILFTAKTLPPDAPDALKFHLDIGASVLTMTPTNDGGSEVNLQLAVCTFDQKGNPGQFMSVPLNREFSANEVQRVVASGLEDIAAIPGPRPAALRLAVMDVPSGRIGSLRIGMDENVPQSRAGRER